MKLFFCALSLCLCASTSAGCDQKPSLPRAKPAPDRAPAPPEEVNPSATLLGDDKRGGAFRMPAAERVVAIGDLHGDFSATERAFRLARVIDPNGKWVGGKTTVVQTGDQLDRGNEERQIIQFLSSLSDDAKAAGGLLVVLNGNHETMNVLGDFRYVLPNALSAFDGFDPPSPLSVQVSGPFKSRAAAMLPGGGAALLFSTRPLVAMVGDTVFAHGGVLPEHVKYGIDKLNRESREWMEGKTTLPPRWVLAEDGPLWTRVYGEPQLPPEACALLHQTLGLLGAARMVVGHTVQERGLTSACDGKVFRIDVGLAAHYGERPVQVLEIRGKKTHILTEKRDEAPPDGAPQQAKR